jgi:hypothetical protein
MNESGQIGRYPVERWEPGAGVARSSHWPGLESPNLAVMQCSHLGEHAPFLRAESPRRIRDVYGSVNPLVGRREALLDSNFLDSVPEFLADPGRNGHGLMVPVEGVFPLYKLLQQCEPVIGKRHSHSHGSGVKRVRYRQEVRCISSPDHSARLCLL